MENQQEKGIIPVIIALIALLIIIIGIVYTANPKAASDTAVEDTVAAGAKMEDGVLVPSPTPIRVVREMADSEFDEVRSGSYEPYAPSKIAWAATGKVVLFFRASWCPTCKALDTYLKEHAAQIPKGVTILDVDYDTAIDLKVKYGVTVQHTLVQVDKKGNLLAKWSGSPDIAGISSQLK